MHGGDTACDWLWGLLWRLLWRHGLSLECDIMHVYEEKKKVIRVSILGRVFVLVLL
jgi:hypothetical protein